MKIFQLLLLIVLIIPFVEIYLLLQIGSFIGPFPTIFLVVFTAVVGTWLLRRQGFATFQRFQASLKKGEIPAYEMIEGPIILLGGVLLLTPGFVTDLMGLVCLIPSLRRKLAQYVIEHFLVLQTGFDAANPNQHQALDGEYRKEE